MSKRCLSPTSDHWLRTLSRPYPYFLSRRVASAMLAPVTPRNCCTRRSFSFVDLVCGGKESRGEMKVRSLPNVYGRQGVCHAHRHGQRVEDGMDGCGDVVDPCRDAGGEMAPRAAYVIAIGHVIAT